MATIEEIKDAINTYLENNIINGYCIIRGEDIIVWFNGAVNRDVVERLINNYAEVTTYTVDMSVNQFVYNYISS